MQVQEESHSSRSHPTRRPATTRPTSQPSHAQRSTWSQTIPAQHSPPDRPTGATPQSVPPPNSAAGPNGCHPPIGSKSVPPPDSNPAGRLVPPLSQPPDHPRPIRCHPSNVGFSKWCHPPNRRPIQIGATLRIGGFRCSVPPLNSGSPGDGCRAPIPGPCHPGDSLPNSRRRNSCLGADAVSACRISALIASISAPNAKNPELRNRH